MVRDAVSSERVCARKFPVRGKNRENSRFAVNANMRPTMIQEMRDSYYLPPGSSLGSYAAPDIAKLDVMGRNVIRDANIRRMRSYGECLIKVYEPAWNKDCADQLCRDRVHAIGLEYVKALLDQQNAAPETPSETVAKNVNIGGYAARAKQEVTVSILRNRARVRIFRPLPTQIPPRPVEQ
jgi:hypothetical protein